MKNHAERRSMRCICDSIAPIISSSSFAAIFEISDFCEISEFFREFSDAVDPRRRLRAELVDVGGAFDTVRGAATGITGCCAVSTRKRNVL